MSKNQKDPSPMSLTGLMQQIKKNNAAMLASMAVRSSARFWRRRSSVQGGVLQVTFHW